MKTKVLITGGCGFIGHHMVEHFIKNTDWDIIIIDKLSYASGGFSRLRDIEVYDDKRVTMLTWDIANVMPEGMKKEIGEIEHIFHVAAETHVTNSIKDPEPFVMSNVVGTMRMLDLARELKNLKTFLYFSTDEVFGPAKEHECFHEWDRYNSGNPYSATKAGGEELCLAYGNTYKLPIMITHCMNVFGERQHAEKYLPICIKKILSGEKIQIHVNEKQEPGLRHYIHARNVAAAVMFLIKKGKLGEKYNIIGEVEKDNLEIAQFVAKTLGKELNYELVVPDNFRPGHDFRYCLKDTKMKDMGWELPVDFEASMKKTIEWTVKNEKWLDHI